jgi:hypothetical protein
VRATAALTCCRSVPTGEEAHHGRPGATLILSVAPGTMFVQHRLQVVDCTGRPVPPVLMSSHRRHLPSECSHLAAQLPDLLGLLSTRQARVGAALARGGSGTQRRGKRLQVVPRAWASRRHALHAHAARLTASVNLRNSFVFCTRVGGIFWPCYLLPTTYYLLPGPTPLCHFVYF